MGARRARAASVVLGIALALVGCLLAGARTAGDMYDKHLLRVTGVQDSARVSCLECHSLGSGPLVQGERRGPRYVSPMGLVVSRDGDTLYATGSGADVLLEVDLERGAVTRTRQLLGSPRGLALSPDGERIAVTHYDADRVSILDRGSLEVVETFEVGPEPTSVVFDSDGERILVATAGTGRVELVPLAGGGEAQRLVAGVDPTHLAIAPGGGLVAAINRRVRPGPPEEVRGAELTLIDARAGRVLARRELTSANNGRGVVVSSDGSFALAPVVHIRNRLPLTQVRRGAVMTSALAFALTAPGGATTQFPLDEENAYFADPAGVALTPDDRIAFVAHGGARVVTAVDVGVLRELLEASDEETLAGFPDDLGLSRSYVLGRMATLDDPGAMAMAPDGSRLYVAERLNDSLCVIDVARLEVVDRIDLGGPRELSTERLGERVFHDADVTFQGQFSCSSCHPEGHTDAVTWDFEIDGIGKNLLETRSLRGIRGTAPFKWNGKNPDLHTQCGPRFARVLTRSQPFSPEDLDHLVAYIESIPVRSRREPAEQLAAHERGRELFFRSHTVSGELIPLRERCDTCHHGPLFTDRQMADVGTGGRFDTPHLLDVASSAPYLHDGRARTLEEIWTVFSPEDEHGVTNDLSKVELNDLVTYLRSL